MKLLSFFVVLLYLTACTSTPKDTSGGSVTSNYSGFLSDYSKLKKVDVGDESDLLRYISRDVKARGYNKVMLDPVSYYPAPHETDTISKDALSKISNYFNESFSQAAYSTVDLVNKPGKNTLRIKMAITGVNIEDSELAAYQYIPIAFLVNAARGGLSEMTVQFQVEAEVVDSLTGEVLAAAVKSGEGEKLADDQTALTLDNLKPLIDSWAKTMRKTLAENF